VGHRLGESRKGVGRRPTTLGHAARGRRPRPCSRPQTTWPSWTRSRS